MFCFPTIFFCSLVRFSCRRKIIVGRRKKKQSKQTTNGRDGCDVFCWRRKQNGTRFFVRAADPLTRTRVFKNENSAERRPGGSVATELSSGRRVVRNHSNRVLDNTHPIPPPPKPAPYDPFDGTFFFLFFSQSPNNGGDHVPSLYAAASTSKLPCTHRCLEFFPVMAESIFNKQTRFGRLQISLRELRRNGVCSLLIQHETFGVD